MAPQQQLPPIKLTILTRLVTWFDFHLVYPLFQRRFTKRFSENPKMREAYIQHMTAFGNQREKAILDRRKTFSVVVTPNPDSDKSPTKV